MNYREFDGVTGEILPTLPSVGVSHRVYCFFIKTEKYPVGKVAYDRI